MEKTLKSNAINYGLYLGIGLSLFTIISYFMDLNLLVNFWIMLLIIPLCIIIIGVISTAKNKSVSNGYLSFRDTFSSYFITVAIGIMISTVVSILIFNFIDVDAGNEVKNILINSTEERMTKLGASSENIIKNIDKIKNQDTYAIGTQLKSLSQSLIVFAIIGLLVAAALKKNKPDTE